MAQQDERKEDRTRAPQGSASADPTFRRHGPEPPENDSGPSPSVEEVARTRKADPVRNVTGDEQGD
jgi:hypothetical protein